MPSPAPLLCAALLLTAPALHAADLPGTRFFHGDWELACDNTRTCRAAGYSVDGAELGIAVLLTRPAGPGQPVTAQVRVGRYDDNPVVDKLPRNFQLTLRINGTPHGAVAFDSASGTSAYRAPGGGVFSKNEGCTVTARVMSTRPSSSSGASSRRNSVTGMRWIEATSSALICNSGRAPAHTTTGVIVKPERVG